MQKAYLLFLYLVLTQTAFATKIVGHISPDHRWVNKVYLQEIKAYADILSGNSALIVDSQELSGKGNFKFDNLKSNSIYKLSVNPKTGTPGMIIEDGATNNYAFVITGNEKTTVFITGDIKSLFLSYSVIGSAADLTATNEKILQLRKLRNPVYEKMRNINLEPLNTLKDEEKIAAYQLSLVREIKAVTERVNKLLLPFLTKETDPNLLAIAAALYQVELANNKDNDQITEHLTSIQKNTQSAILLTVLEVLKKSRKEIKPDFMFDKTYLLMESKNFNFLSPRMPAKFILMDFWASWCTPCRKAIKTELPLLIKKYTPQQLQIIGIVVNDEFQQAEQAIKKDKNPHTQIYDHDNYLANYFEIQGIPYYVIINQETQEIKAFRTFFAVQDYLAEAIKE